MSDVDRRSVQRRRTLFNGRIVVNAAGSSLDVKVRNLSSGGDRLEAYGTAFLPAAFQLKIQRVGAPDEIHDARRIWIEGEKMGIAFLN